MRIQWPIPFVVYLHLDVLGIRRLENFSHPADGQKSPQKDAIPVEVTHRPSSVELFRAFGIRFSPNYNFEPLFDRCKLIYFTA
jgi:hypothetical protein